MRLIMAALVMIILTSYCHRELSDLFSWSMSSESRFYRLGMFWSAAIGSYGVVMTVFGFVLSPIKNDAQVRLLPLFFSIFVMIYLFFYLLSNSIDAPSGNEQRQVRPGETITI
jgi:hypothetical protein